MLALICAVATLLLATSSSLAQDSDPQPLLFPGNAVVTGFSGTSTAYSDFELPENSSIADETFLNTDGASLRVIELEGARINSQNLTPYSPQLFDVRASETGQIFGVALDDAKLPDGETSAPNAYGTATSAYGLYIVGPDADGDSFPERLKVGAPDAKWMPGLFGLEKGGGPGSVWKIDGITGEVSLFANIEFDGAPNSGPGLGNIVFDPASRQLFVSERDTGMIHRLDLQGEDRGSFDHGLDGRPARGLHPVGFDPDERTNITSDEFVASDPETWGYASPERRIWGLAMHKGRLYYAVAEGPQIWSVAINKDGSFGRARWEIDLPDDIEPYEVSDITFTSEGRMVLAQRAPVTGAYDYVKPIESGGARVLRYRLERPNRRRTPSRWVAEPDEYAIGQTGDYRNTDGGVAIGYGYTRAGNFNYRACRATLWTTGDRLKQVARRTLAPRTVAAKDDKLFLDGLQGNALTLVRPENEPPTNARFIDYDGAYQTHETAGHVGDVEIPVICDPGEPYTPPPPPPPAQRILDLEIEKKQIGVCSIFDICSFEITVRNRGTETHRGPLVIRDVVSQSGMSLVSFGAVPWRCVQTGVEISCRRPELVLRPGRETRLYVDFKLLAKILIPGWRNCSTITWLGDPNSEITVRAVQLEMTNLGFYAGPIDGQMTPATNQAISDLQVAAGLPATGEVSPELLEILFGPGAHRVGDANPDNDQDCADVEYIAPPAPGPGVGPGPGPGPWPVIAALKVTIGGPAECPFGVECPLGLTIRNTLPVPFDQEIDGLVELKRLGVEVPEQIAQWPSFCAGPVGQMGVNCRFRLQLGPNQARSYPMRLNIQNALLDPSDAANQAPDGLVRAEACFVAEDLGWFGWLFGQEIDRDCHSFVVPDAAAAPGGPGDEEAPGGPGDEGAPGGPGDEGDDEEAPESAGNLEITKTAKKSSCRREAVCLFDIIVKNTGAATTGDRIRFIESFPEGLRNNVIASSDGIISCEQQTGRRFICSGSRDQAVAPGQEFKLEATLVAGADNQAPGLENCVTLDKDGDGVADADEVKSCAKVKLTTDPGDEPRGPPPPELTVTMRAINTTCKPGIGCWFKLIVTNTGKKDFRGELELRDFVKIGTTNPGWPIEFGSLGRWRCDAPSDALEYRKCMVSDIAARDSRSLALKVLVPQVGDLPIPFHNRRILTNCASIHYPSGNPNGEVISKQACAGANIDIRNQVGFLKLEKIAPGECPAGGRCEFHIRIFARGERGLAQNFTLIDQAKKIGGTQISLPIVAGGPGCTTPPDRIPFNCRRRLSLPPFQNDPQRLLFGEDVDNADSVVTELSYQVQMPSELKAGDRFENCFHLLFSFEGKTYRPVSCTTVSVTGDPEEFDRVTQDLTPEDEAPADEPPVRQAPLAGRFGPQLSVTKVADSRSCTPGEECGFSVSIANRGVAPYFGSLVFSDRMKPGNVRLVGTAPSPWRCRGSNGRFTCSHPSTRLDVGATKTVRLRFRTSKAARGTQNNCAQFTWRDSTAGAQIVAAKQALSKLGLDPGPANARVTRQTRDAIRRFQREQKLRVTGTVDSGLMKALVRTWGQGDQNAGDDTACIDVAFGRIPDTSTPVACPQGQRRDGNACVPICTGGRTLVSGRCQCTRGQVFDAKANRCRAQCASGTRWDGKQCVSRCPEAERWDSRRNRCVNRCSSSQRWDGNRCVSRCSSSQRWDSRRNRCVNRCSSSQRWDGKNCVSRCSSSQRWDSRRNRCVNRCSSSQRWDGKNCVNRCSSSQRWDAKRNRCVNRCSSSQRWDGKNCINRCSSNQRWDAKRNRCVNRCTGGKQWRNNRCQCPSGQSEVRGKCITVQTTPGSGQTTNPGQSEIQPIRCTGGKVVRSGKCACPTGLIEVRGRCVKLQIQPEQTINPNLSVPR